MNEEQTKGSPWDVFIHLLAVIALYASIVGALMLLFQYVNLALPDAADSQIDIHQLIREGVALLLIFFPAYVWAWRSIDSDLAANPSKQRLWVRTCPMYLTIFLAGLLALGDLACLVYNFMGGDLTSRFLLKVVGILVVTGAVLWFYLNALRREPGPMPTAARTVAYGSPVVAAALVIAGFVLAGSPGRARLARLDHTRLQDLHNIQAHIVDYWQDKAVLPASLDELKDPISDFLPPHDPVNNEPYGYRVINPTSFALCANFALRDLDTKHSLPYWMLQTSSSGDIWNHQAGHFCFTRTIDPARHPPRKPTAPRRPG